MVFINVCLFQKTVLHLIPHHSFTPSSLLNHQTGSEAFSFSSFTHCLYFSETPPLNHITPNFVSLHFSFLSLKPTFRFVIFFVPLSFSVSTEGNMNGPWSSCIFDMTNKADILPWTRPMLHYTCIDLQLLCKSRHWHQTVERALLLFQWRLTFTTHTICWLLLSPLGTVCAYSFITHGHGGNQTTNPASVTVTLYPLSHTESFLLAWDYSKIFCSTGPNANTNSSTASLVHEFMKSRTLSPIFHTAFKCGAVFWCEQDPITAQSKEMLNKMIGQERAVFSRTFFTSQATVRSSDSVRAVIIFRCAPWKIQVCTYTDTHTRRSL